MILERGIPVVRLTGLDDVGILERMIAEGKLNRPKRTKLKINIEDMVELTPGPSTTEILRAMRDDRP